MRAQPFSLPKKASTTRTYTKSRKTIELCKYYLSKPANLRLSPQELLTLKKNKIARKNALDAAAAPAAVTGRAVI